MISALIKGSGTVIEGFEEIQKMLQDEAKAVKAKRMQAMIDASELLEAYIIQSMINTEKNENPRSWSYAGRVSPHKPSLPYNPPAIDTHNLEASIKHFIFEEEYQVYSDVGSFNVDYAMDLEFGAPGMEPRPWLGPAFTANQVKIEERFKAVISPGIY